MLVPGDLNQQMIIRNYLGFVEELSSVQNGCWRLPIVLTSKSSKVFNNPMPVRQTSNVKLPNDVRTKSQVVSDWYKIFGFSLH